MSSDLPAKKCVRVFTWLHPETGSSRGAELECLLKSPAGTAIKASQRDVGPTPDDATIGHQF